MRTSNTLFLISCGLLIGCSNQKLSKEEAANEIKKEYPRVIDMYIYTGDPEEAKRLRDAGLETEGFVIIKKKKAFDDNSPWIGFTENAKPYLLETDPKDKENLTQKAKTATEEFIEVSHIEQDDENKTAEATYQTKITAITPFGKLVKLKENEVKKRKAKFAKDNNGWHLKEQQEK
jgi:hypothetical protein